MKPFAVSILAAAALASGCTTTSRMPTSPVANPPLAPTRIAEEVTTLATSSGNIEGTLMLPVAAYPMPVALIIAGSGPTDRNGNSRALPGANNSLRMLADSLAARGIATVRYDKRGIAASAAAGAREEDLRFTHYTQDAADWIRKLRADPRFSTITVIGHSEGSLIGIIAAREARADGLVSVAGAGRRPQDIIIEQLTGQLPDSIVKRAREFMRRIEAGESPDSVPPILAALFRPSVRPYLASWFRYDPPAELARLTVPVLIIQGTTDIQVSQDDAKRLSAGSPAARLVIIDGMNHVLKAAQGTRGEQMPAYSDSTLPVMSRLIEEIATFVRKLPGVARESAFGADKVKHFFIAAFVESVGFAGLRAGGADKSTAVAGAVGGTAAVSLGREVYDRRTKGAFSVLDLVWDALGAGAALLVLTRTQK